MLLKAGEAGKSNVAVKGQCANLPAGVAAALQDETSATVQLLGSAAPVCLSATLNTVKIADGVQFKAE